MNYIQQRAALDRSDLDLIQRMERVLSNRQRNRLSAVKYRLIQYPQRFGYYDYPSTVGLVLMSDWEHSHRFCHCCIRNKKCKLWKFCCHCAYVKQRELIEKYALVFRNHRFWSATISFQGHLNFEVPRDEEPLPYWDAISQAIRRMFSQGLIQGAIWSEELYLDTFLPLVVTPHCHVIFHADALSTAVLVEALETAINDLNSHIATDASNDAVNLAPDILVKRIEDLRQFTNTLAYAVKPIDLVRPYRSQLIDPPYKLTTVELNQAVDCFLNAHHLHCFQRAQLRFVGTLDSKRKRLFLGGQHHQHDMSDL